MEEVARLKNNQVIVTSQEASVTLIGLAPRDGENWHKVLAVNRITMQERKITQVLLGRLATAEGMMGLGRALLSGYLGVLADLDPEDIVLDIVEDGVESRVKAYLSPKTVNLILGRDSGLGVGADFKSSESVRHLFNHRADFGQWP